MKVLITGASGNVGYYLSKFFISKKINVIGLDIKNHGVFNGNPDYKFYNCNVLDSEKLKEIFKTEQPTHVIHLAFLMRPLHDKKKYYAIDVNGTKNVINISNGTSSVKQFIEFSSTSIYGGWPNHPLWLKEETPIEPRDYVYGIHKKIIENYINSFDKRKDLKFVILRMCTVIGDEISVRQSLVKLIYDSKVLMKFHGETTKLQFIHEDDMTELVYRITKDKKIEGVFNLAPDSYSSVNELVPNKKFINLNLGFSRFLVGVLWTLRLVWMNPGVITITAYDIIADGSKLAKRFNYKFKYTTKEAFDNVISVLKNKGAIK